MKLQVTQENLNRALSSVARVASERSTLPILANVLFKTINNRLSVSATNLDIAITHFIGAKISDNGSITVPARLLQDFISSMPSDVISLELENNKLHIKSKMYNSVINGVSSEEFPVMPTIEKGNSWEIDTNTLKAGLQQVIIAASSDDTRPVLTGVYFNTRNKKLYVAATDSYRLAEKELMDSEKEINLLIPASAIQDLLRVMGDTQDKTIITYDDQQVCFRVGDIELVARLIEGKYPDYHQLIPSKFNTTVSLPTAELTNITKVSALFARENAGSITINVNETEQNITIHSIASQLGENTASTTAKIKGDGVVTINSRYLLEALHVINEPDARCSFNGKLDAVVITANTTKPDYIHIIMPLKS